jgi:5'-methylthioadenosine phosphorylase
MGFSVIGMTNLTEAKLAREAEICYTTAAFVTDFDSWHETEEPVTLEMILGHLAANRDLSCQLIRLAAKEFSKLPRKCACPDAMASAIVSNRDCIPPEIRQKYAVIFGKYLN